MKGWSFKTSRTAKVFHPKCGRKMPAPDVAQTAALFDNETQNDRPSILFCFAKGGYFRNKFLLFKTVLFFKTNHSQTQFASVKFIASTVKGPKKPAGGQMDKTPELVPNICVCCPRGELYVRLKGGDPVKFTATSCAFTRTNVVLSN